MTLRAFIGIIVAVALGVHFGLKIHDNPDYLDDLLILLWNLFKLLLLLGLIVGVTGGAIYGIWWLFENGDTIELPSGVDTVIGTLGVIVALAIVVALIYSRWLGVKNKGGFKNWLQDKKTAGQKRIANLKGEEKARHERIKKYKKILVIALIIIALLMLPGIIISLFD